MKDSAHGVTARTTPPISSLGPDGMYAGFAESGGVKIVEGQVYIGGNNVTSLLPAQTIGSTTVADNRENQNIQVYVVDLGKLKQYMEAENVATNSLLWCGRTDCSEDAPNGYQFTNGSELPGQGLTIATPNPVYLRGDFNTQNEIPAAILCDALTLLSNAWDGTKALGQISAADDTTYNAAILTGFMQSEPGAGYSGGVGNMVRFLEHWYFDECTVKGSFVALGESQYARAPYKSLGVYTEPNRSWSFNESFNDPDKLPPFTPMIAKVGRLIYTDID